MTFSNAIAFFIMLTTAVTLHAPAITDIQSSAQAAEALRPIAGEFAFMLFAAGIIGTGLLAMPVLAGSAAYAVAEAIKWPIGLRASSRCEAKGFYGIIALATLVGVALDFTPIDPIKALFWSAVINGVVAVPIMAVMMRMAVRPEIMGAFTITPRLQRLGWIATAVDGDGGGGDAGVVYRLDARVPHDFFHAQAATRAVGKLPIDRLARGEPSNADPTGARTEILPARTSLSSGYTSVT